MDSCSSDGDAPSQTKIPTAAKMLLAWNLRRLIGSGTGLRSEELEFKKILQQQKKSAEDGGILSFYKKKPEEGSITHEALRLANSLFLKKQSDFLLNDDDLEAMWVCLSENCVIDDATREEEVNYEDFCRIASVCTEQIGTKCRRFFSQSNFKKFENDESQRISIRTFYDHVELKVLLMKTRIEISKQDKDSDGFLQPKEMELYIRGLIPDLAQLRDMPAALVPFYFLIAVRKFFFFCDPHKRGKACIKKVLLSKCLEELMNLRGFDGTGQAGNWFSLTSARRIKDMFIALDRDGNRRISRQDLRDYAGGTLTDIFIERVFDEHVGRGNAREMDFNGFLDFVLALENRNTPEGLTYLFRCLDLCGRGFLTTADIHTLFREVHQKWIEAGRAELRMEDVRNEIWDMVKPADGSSITLSDLIACKQGGTVASMLIDVRGLWEHENR